MKLVSWNVNGFRAVIGKNFWEWFRSCDADVVCLQETKAHPDQLAEADKSPAGYVSYWNASKVKKGYSGTAVFCRTPPLSVSYGLPDARFQGEGRAILLEFDAFHLFNIYFPNGQKDEARLAYKMGYYDAFLEYAQHLRRTKPVAVCGDFNTAHKPIDLARPKENEQISGFLPCERAWLDTFEKSGYKDVFRLYETEGGHYTWWSYRMGARARNVGWRIDYFWVSEELQSKAKQAWIEAGVMGSDHCPVGLELDL